PSRWSPPWMAPVVATPLLPAVVPVSAAGERLAGDDDERCRQRSVAVLVYGCGRVPFLLSCMVFSSQLSRVMAVKRYDVHGRRCFQWEGGHTGLLSSPCPLDCKPSACRCILASGWHLQSLLQNLAFVPCAITVSKR